MIEINDAPGYFVTRDGEVFYRKNGGLIRKVPTKVGGHPVIVIDRRSSKQRFGVARLVAKYFIGDPPEDKPLVLHRDKDKNNNHVDNLYYGDHYDANREQIDIQKKEKADRRSFKRLVAFSHEISVLIEDGVKIVDLGLGFTNKYPTLAATKSGDVYWRSPDGFLPKVTKARDDGYIGVNISAGRGKERSCS